MRKIMMSKEKACPPHSITPESTALLQSKTHINSKTINNPEKIETASHLGLAAEIAVELLHESGYVEMSEVHH